MNLLRALLDERAGAGGDFASDLTDASAVGYRDLAARATAWSRWLDDGRVPAGAAVGCLIADPVGFAVTYVGLLAADRRVVPLDPKAPAGAADRICRAAGAELIVTDQPAETDQTGNGPIRHRTGPRGAPPAGTSTAGHGSGPHVSRAIGSAADGAASGGGALLFSSGTTGEPKGIPLDIDRLLHTAANVATALELSTADRCFCPLPTHHVNAQVVAILATIHAGAAVVLAPGFHRTGFWKTVAAADATWINAVPAIVAILADDAEESVAPGGIRLIRTGSAPLPEAVTRRFETRFGIPVIETYGMTEAASQITANPVRGTRRPGSVGRPVGLDLAVRRADGSRCDADETGRVHIRGRAVIGHYLGNRYPERFDADGWLDTGDLGRLDADGNLFLAGRSDDVINRGGQKILPRSVEDTLRADPAVADVAVVGRPDPVLGEVPVAIVAATDDVADPAALTERLLARCTERLPRYQVPVEVRWVPRIPRGMTGKVTRGALVELATAAA